MEAVGGHRGQCREIERKSKPRIGEKSAAEPDKSENCAKYDSVLFIGTGPTRAADGMRHGIIYASNDYVQEEKGDAGSWQSPKMRAK